MPKLRRQRWEKKEHSNLRVHRGAPGTAGLRRNHGKDDKITWNGGSFISPPDVDGDLEDSLSDEEDEILQLLMESLAAGGPQERKPIQISLSLLDVARPAKIKGIAKDFEVVETPQRVLVLPEEEEEDIEDSLEDWESIYAEDMCAQHEERRTYSAVLRGNDER